MFTRLLAVLCLAALPTFACAATDAPPNEASVRQLLEVMQVHKLLDSMMGQVEGVMTQATKQATQGQPITPDVQKQIDKGRAEAMAMMKEILDWNKLEPIYVRIYQKSFTQKEIDDLIAMYKTPGGQALLNKMPIVMQNSMAEMQQMMQPIMQRIQRMQQDVAAQIQTDKAKKG